MPAEMHVGARPGRPALLVVLCGATLLAALGLAQFQIRQLRALSSPIAIPDTPLVVQVPREWRADPERADRFLLPIRDERRRQIFTFERRVQFAYERRSAFEPASRVMRRLGLDDPRMVEDLRAARIGSFPAVEAKRVDMIPYARSFIRRERIIRFACLPRGDVIQVIYEPLDAIRPADIEILDEICASLRVEDDAVNTPGADLLDDAGVVFTLDPNWTVTGPHLEHVPGLYVGGTTRGVPSFGIGVLRTWLAPGRTPRDLLADLAAEQWLEWDVAPSETGAAGERQTAYVRHPQFGQTDEPLQSAWVVADAPTQAVVILAYAGPRGADEADAIAKRIADEIQIEPRRQLASLDAAVAAGRQLADQLAERGAMPRWGREPVEVEYAGRFGLTPFALTSRRAALKRDPQRGYEGREETRFGGSRSRGEGILTEWTIDGRAGAYTYQSEFATQGGRVLIEERRRVGGDVQREVTLEGRAPRRWNVQPGEAFIPPPVETVAAGWVARGGPDVALIEALGSFGSTTHTQLLRRLADDQDWPRVLVIRDYLPTGVVQAFDADRAVIEYETAPGYSFRRTGP